MDKYLEWQQIYGAKEREGKSLPSRMDWGSNPRIKSSDLGGMWGGGIRWGRRRCSLSREQRDEELPGRAGAAALKSLCSAQGLGAARQSVAPRP